MIKICQTGFAFSGFCQKFSQVMDEVEIWDGLLYLNL
jgi:hypothetical protein